MKRPLLAHGMCLCIHLSLCVSLNLGAQSLSPQVLSNGGNTLSTNTGRLSWTLGEVAVAKWESFDQKNVLTEGFHQPKLQVSAILQPEVLVVQVMPNPVHSMLNLKVLSEQTRSYRVQLYDAQGKIIYKDVLLNGQQDFNLESLATGVYFLSIFNTKGLLLQQHKVIKL